MTDVLVFLTFVYIYSTNATGLTNPGSVLFESAFVRPNNALIPPIFVLMLFTWLVAAVIGLAEESMGSVAPAMGWWWTGLGLHARRVGAWLIYGLIQGIAPGAGDAYARHVEPGLLNLQLDRGRSLWLLYIRRRRLDTRRRHRLCGRPCAIALPAAGRSGSQQRPASCGRAGHLLDLRSTSIWSGRHRFKQGQQFDSQGNWLSSVNSTSALATRQTEDHYTLFPRRALLEQAKRAPVQARPRCPPPGTLRCARP